jgi:hypothetical protein
MLILNKNLSAPAREVALRAASNYADELYGMGLSR